jgi:hypothetical protein
LPILVQGRLLMQGAKMKHPTKNQPTTSAVEHHGDHQLTAEQMAHIKRFIEEVGGIENARQTLLALDELQKAA